MRGNKKQIISIILAGAGLIGFVVAICFIFFGPRGIDDNYFINSDRRIVLSIDNPSSKLMYGAKKVHRVYEVSSDDKITSYKLYYTYENSGAASSKLEEAKNKSLEDINIESVEQNGKYIIVKMKKSMYENTTPDEMREIVNNLRSNIRTENHDPTEPEEYLEENDEE